MNNKTRYAVRRTQFAFYVTKLQDIFDDTASGFDVVFPDCLEPDPLVSLIVSRTFDLLGCQFAHHEGVWRMAV
jgi:hypothetical protein